MFTLIALGDRRRLDLQRRRDLRSRRLSARVPQRGWRCRRLFRGGGGHHRAGAARPGAGVARARANRRRRSARCSTSRRRRARRIRRRRRRRRCRARGGRGRRPPARAARATRSRSTARSSTARAPSTNRWSPANRCRCQEASRRSGLIGGTVNGSGGLVMRAERVGRDTVLAQIVELVAEAQRSRAPIQRLADQVSRLVRAARRRGRRRSPSSPGSTFGPEPRFAFGLVAAVSVLIIACPCALGLATPMSIMVGVGARRAVGRADQATPRRWSGSRRSTRWSSTRPAR